ncbi:MAG: hypothetical protein LC539_18505 [Candidatus Thiodiazotropha sp.]|nr:hypothetical protein [Candidatus Thiodiazotropha sp.]
MAETKSTTLTVRVHPAVKEGLRTIAEQERRSMANMVEVMIRDYCGRNDIEIQGAGFTENDKGRRG